ncbi:MAG: hypothetical protein H6966_05940 [Chromatiaceae bacterium]|nr:hypothetical protein [Chromatiaceae bacterium]
MAIAVKKPAKPVFFVLLQLNPEAVEYEQALQWQDPGKGANPLISPGDRVIKGAN